MEMGIKKLASPEVETYLPNRPYRLIVIEATIYGYQAELSNANDPPSF